MELSANNLSAATYPPTNETRADQWQRAAHARELRQQIRADETGENQRVIEAYKVERVNYVTETRELRPTTYDNTSTHLKKVRSFLTVAQNGMQLHLVDLYV